jgi:hypothetical protein
MGPVAKYSLMLAISKQLFTESHEAFCAERECIGLFFVEEAIEKFDMPHLSQRKDKTFLGTRRT